MRRPAYRWLWLGAVVSLAGDWFTLIALYSLLQEYTGRGESVGLMLLMRFLPPALFGPLAGVLADRLPRRTLLITCDVLRALVVLGFLGVRSAEDVWLVYTLVFLQMTLSACFDPAEQAAIGSVVAPEEIVTATTLHGMTWAAMLSVGAVAGGAVSAWVGREAAFVIDAASYLVSALIISRAEVPHVEHPSRPATWASLTGVEDVREGLRLLQARPELWRTLWVKTGWALPGGGALVLYTIMGERLFPLAGSGEAGIGVLLGMRGVGALLGPLVARHVGGDRPEWLERAIGMGFLVTAVFWLGFAWAPTLPVAAVLLGLAHTGISTQWTFSSSLLTLQVEDRLRGRLFALDFMAYTLALGGSSWLIGYLLDRLSAGPRTLMSVLAGVLLLSYAVWWWLRPPQNDTFINRTTGSSP